MRFLSSAHPMRAEFHPSIQPILAFPRSFYLRHRAILFGDRLLLFAHTSLLIFPPILHFWDPAFLFGDRPVYEKPSAMVVFHRSFYAAHGKFHPKHRTFYLLIGFFGLQPPSFGLKTRTAIVFDGTLDLFAPLVYLRNGAQDLLDGLLMQFRRVGCFAAHHLIGQDNGRQRKEAAHLTSLRIQIILIK